MKISRLLLISATSLTAITWFSFTKAGKRISSLYIPKHHIGYPLKSNIEEKLRQKAEEAKRFVQQKKYNSQYCFLIDMSLPSGQKRFFIYDLIKDSVKASGLVAHGNCFEYWLEDRKYSNVVGSGCTSLGKYKIGYPYTGKFGYSYKLYGLDSTNSNAFERTVVLHSYTDVPESETNEEICQSNGCPMVSPGFLQQLKTIINTSKKPLLLWIYD